MNILLKMIADENPDLTRSFGVKQAPTIVVTNGTDFVKFADLNGVNEFINSKK